MAKKSLIIHDLDNLDFKYLPAIADIITYDLDDYETKDIFIAAAWFMDALASNQYGLEDEDDKRAIVKFVEGTQHFLDELKKNELTKSPKLP